METISITEVAAETATEIETIFARPDAEELADEAILGSAADAKVGKVRGRVYGFRQSANSRAWTMGGSVD